MIKAHKAMDTEVSATFGTFAELDTSYDLFLQHWWRWNHFEIGHLC